ncbi:MAG: hypothetical protein WBP81_24075 [Solirubrobacteraceae bacterium]
MAPSDHDKILEIVDEVIGDLRLRDRMFTARRPDPGRPEVIVIQTGEDGRHVLPIPNLEQPRTLETFIAAAQAHLFDVYGQPVPLCPRHDHALVARVELGGIDWVCPDGAWRCAVGDYEENTWPPPLAAGDLAAALSARLTRRGVRGVRRIGCMQQDGEWVVQVGIWPMSPAIIDAVTEAAAPMAVKIEPRPGTLPRRVTAHTPSAPNVR